MSPDLLVDPVSPQSEFDSGDVTTVKEQKDLEYPYLKPIKDGATEQALNGSATASTSSTGGRLSPDIPLHAPIPVKGKQPIILANICLRRI